MFKTKFDSKKFAVTGILGLALAVNVAAYPFQPVEASSRVGMACAKSGHILIENFDNMAKNRDADLGTLELVIEEDREDQVQESFEEAVKKMSFLTEEQKQRLLKSEKIVNGYYDQIEELDEKMDKIYDEIFGDFEEKAYDEIEDILAKNDTLWEKLDKEMEEGEFESDDINELIKNSKTLSSSEIDILLRDQKVIDEWMRKIEDKYQVYDQRTVNLEAELEGLYQKIDDIDTKNDDIWEKILGEGKIIDSAPGMVLY